MLGGADNANGDLPSYITGANNIPAIGVCCARHTDGYRAPGLALSLPSNDWYQVGPSVLPPVVLLFGYIQCFTARFSG
ncbi:hypothetical protein E1890_21430 [Salmonella enterica subsp. enterica serovar Mountpleasant]|nr:hypothetical protein [Salmonella enterica subsp. enterica serovar Mountpleasant]